MAEDTEIRFTAPNSVRRTGLPRRLHNGHVLEFTSFSDQTTLSLLYESLKVMELKTCKGATASLWRTKPHTPVHSSSSS